MKLAERVISIVNEVTITNGMKASMEKDATLKCSLCKLPIPKYTGRYPEVCPDCGGELVPPEECEC